MSIRLFVPFYGKFLAAQAARNFLLSNKHEFLPYRHSGATDKTMC